MASGGLDPLSLALSATQVGIGGLQSLFGFSRERKAEKELENLQTPQYAPNKAISDYYNEALNRYSVNPYSSQFYKTAQNTTNRNIASGLNVLRGRNTVSGVSRLVALGNDSMQRAGITAEGLQSQNFGQLGNAANAKSRDDMYGFQINKLMPYQKKLQLLGLKASGGAQTFNAGLQNMFGGLQTAAIIANDNSMNRNPNYQTNGYNPQYNGGVNMNNITGGVNGNMGTLNSGNPFNNYFIPPNTYGE